jgi:hypothetical protein
LLLYLAGKFATTLRKPSLIIAAVAAYTLFETLLLLSYLLPEVATYPGLRYSILALAQFLTIPGMAVLFSLILYGRNQWKRRLLLYFVTVPGFFTLIVLMLLPVALLEWAFEKWGVDPGDSVLIPFASFLYPVVIFAVVSTLLFLINRKAQKRSVELESSRWLAERQARVGAIERKSRERAIRWSLWIPSLIVLAVFLFLPEVWGLVTHMRRPRAGQLPGYEVTIPPTWIITFNGANSLTGASWVNGIAGRGMGLDVRRYLHFGELPLSSWGIGIAEFDEPVRRPLSRGESAVAQRDFQIGKAKLTCFEYRPSWGRPMRGDAEPVVLIECAGSDRLGATFIGEKIHVLAFYGMLASMTPALPPKVK